MPRILLAEDDAAVRGMLQAVLERDGFEVVAVANVREALSRIAAENFDVLACDFSALRVGSSTYGGQLVAKFYSRGRQAVDAVLAVAVFVCRCAFVDVRLAPSQ